MLEFRVRAMVKVKVRARVRLLGHETPGYEKVRVRNVWKPWFESNAWQNILVKPS